MEAAIASIYSGHLSPEAKELLGELGLLANLLHLKLKEEKPEEQDGELLDSKDLDIFPDTEHGYEEPGHRDFFSDGDSDYSDFEDRPQKRKKKNRIPKPKT